MQKFKLSAIIEIISGGTPKTSVAEYWNGDIPWLSVVDFGDCNKYVYNTEKQITPLGLKESATKVLNAEDIILSARGTVGALAMLGRPMAFNQSCFGLRAKSDVLNQHYLYYYLRNYIRNLKQRCQGSVFDTINLSTFDTLDVYIPCLEEQNKVASLLSSIDLKIDNNNRIISEIESMAKTIYDYWFLQFDFPDENGKPYKSSGGKMVWNEELKREIPEGWEYKPLIDIESNIITGKTPPTTDLDNYNGNIPFITIGDMRDNIYVVKTAQMLSTKGANSQFKKYLPNDSIVVSCIATIGLVSITTQYSQTNQQINGIVISNDFNIYFLYFALKNHFTNSINVKTGNTFSNMNKNEFSNIRLLYNQEIVRLYYKESEKLFKQIKILQLENNELVSLRDFLLPMLMNGQVTFKDLK